MTKSILLLPGDGIGPEVLAEASRVLDALRENHGLNVEIQTDCLGGAAIDRYGVPLADETLQRGARMRARDHGVCRRTPVERAVRQAARAGIAQFAKGAGPLREYSPSPVF